MAGGIAGTTRDDGVVPTAAAAVFASAIPPQQILHVVPHCLLAVSSGHAVLPPGILLQQQPPHQNTTVRLTRTLAEQVLTQLETLHVDALALAMLTVFLKNDDQQQTQHSPTHYNNNQQQQQQQKYQKQLAGILLRQLVERHWDQHSRTFQQGGTVINQQTKELIRQTLPQGLGSPWRPMRTACSMIIAIIASSDYPERWPQLLPGLIVTLRDGTGIGDRIAMASGCLHCLCLIAEDITDAQVVSAIPVLFPVLLSVVIATKQQHDAAAPSFSSSPPSSPSGCESSAAAQTAFLFPAVARGMAVLVFRTLALGIRTIDREAFGATFEAVLDRLLVPYLPQWLPVLQQVMLLQPPQSTQTNNAVASPAYVESIIAADESDTDEHGTVQCSLRIEAIRTVRLIFENYTPAMIGSVCTSFAPAALSALSMLFPLYQRVCLTGINHTSDAEHRWGACFDSEGNALGMPVFAIELLVFLETVITTVPRKKLRALGLVQPVVECCIRYLAMSNEDITMFMDDLNEYAAVEDGIASLSLSSRADAASLLSQVLTKDRKVAVGHIVHVVTKQLWPEAVQERAGGATWWWRKQEAGLFAVGLAADALVGYDRAMALSLLKDLVMPVMNSCSSSSGSPRPQQQQHRQQPTLPFLYARAIWTVNQLVTLVGEEELADVQNTLCPAILTGFVTALQEHRHPVVRIAAVRALGLSSQTIAPVYVSAILRQALPLVCSLLACALTHSLHTILESLMLIVGVDVTVTAECAPALTDLLLRAWQSNLEDRMVTEGVVEVIEQMLEVKQCLGMVMNAVVPVVVQVLNRGAAQAQAVASAAASSNARNEGDDLLPGTVEAVIDLLRGILVSLKSHELPASACAQVYDLVLPGFMALVRYTDDHGVLGSCVLCLTEFIHTQPGLVPNVQIRGTQDSAVQKGSVPTLRMVCDCIARVLEPTMSEDAALGIGSLVYQVMSHYGGRQLDTASMTGLYRAVLIRFHSSFGATLMEDLAMLSARLVLLFGEAEFVSMLRQLGVIAVKERVETGDDHVTASIGAHNWREVHIPAAQVLFSKWVMVMEDAHAPYPTKVMVSALVRILQHLSLCPDLANMRVRGYVDTTSMNNGGYALRSRGKKGVLKYGTVSLFAKLLAIVSREAQQACGQKDAEESKHGMNMGVLGAGAANNLDFREEDDDSDFGDGEAKLFGLSGEEAVGFSAYMNLSDMCDLADDPDFNDEYPGAKDDPLNEIDIGEVVSFSVTLLYKDFNASVVRAVNECSEADRLGVERVLSGEFNVAKLK